MKDFKILLVEDERQMAMFIENVESEEGKGTKTIVTLNIGMFSGIK